MILERIEKPCDIKKFSIHELETLADEIRHKIIEVVSENGGHLAPSLGAVELIIALLYIFDVPPDKVIWDVGHQAYAYKLVTDRRDVFTTLRKLGGISGFLRKDESDFDFFTTGHAGTSLSAALGISQLAQSKTIAVIGDGAITSGMAYEAMNIAGELRSNIIVVLNDNGMSIAKNRGAIASYLTKKFASPAFWRLREGVKSFLKRAFPTSGEDMIRAIRRAEDSFMSFVTPGILFEGLGFRYFGPFDGHSIPQLIDIFSKLKRWEGPVFVHVKTKKGRGYPPAEKDPEKFHGVGPFFVETGKPKKKEKTPSFSRVFGEFLCELAEKDERIVAITAAMPAGTGLDVFAHRFPKRFYDVGIAEQHAVTFAAGLATEGLKPFVAIYSTFLQRSFDQIVHDVSLQRLHVVFCIDRGGIVGEDGATHHGLFDVAYLRIPPNMVLMAPSDENELKDMMLTALHLSSPCAIRYPKGNVFKLKERDPTKIPVGKAEIVRPGKDVLILGYGTVVKTCLEAAKRLKKHRVDACVVNARFAKPIDEHLIKELGAKINKVVTIEEGTINGGFGSAVAELGLKPLRLGVPDTFVEHGSREELLRIIGLDSDGITTSILRFLDG